MNDLADIHQLRRSVSIHRHPVFPPFVRLADIPQPWLERFLEELIGSQMPIIQGEENVIYATDWQLFLSRAERRLRAETIAEILRDFRAGPSPNALQAAPEFSSWLVIRDPVGDLCLLGAVSGHPRLPGDQRWILSSMLIGLDRDAGNARTISRWYRLGKLVDLADCEVLDGKALNPALTPVDLDALEPWFQHLLTLVAREGFDV